MWDGRARLMTQVCQGRGGLLSDYSCWIIAIAVLLPYLTVVLPWPSLEYYLVTAVCLLQSWPSLSFSVCL